MTTPVTITGAGQLRRMAPALPLVGNLRVCRLEALDDGGSRAGLVAQALFSPFTSTGGGAGVEVWRGLEAVATGLHKDADVPVVVGRVRPVRPLVVRAADGVTDPAVVAFVAAHTAGLLRYDADAVEVTWLIVQICLAFDARVVVIVRTKADAAAVTHLLMRHGIDPAATAGGTVATLVKRVTVALLGQTGGIDLRHADLVLVADALHATWADPLVAPLVPAPGDPDAPGGPAPAGLLERLLHAGEARVVGFLPLDRHRSPFDAARCWQVYGDAELVVPRSAAVERPVMTASVDVGNIKAAKNTVPYVKNKVRMDPVRNRRLAGVARALRVDDRGQLARLLPAAQLAWIAAGPRHVLLLADTLKQALALSRRLPAWPVVSGLGDDPRPKADDPAAGTRGVIATALGVEALAGGEFDVVVRADPGSGMPPLPSNWLEATVTPAPPLMVVDARDAGHPLAALWSRGRRRAARAAGWAVLGEDPDVTAWRRFRALVLDRGERP